MTLGVVLSILLAVLDYTGQADLSLTQILIPIFIELGLYVVIFLGWLAFFIFDR